MADQLREIVSSMMAAGESEQNIAAVIERLSAEPAPAAEKPWYQRTPEDIPAIKQLHDENPLVKKMSESIMGGGVGGGLLKVGAQGIGLGEKVARRIYSGLLKPKQALKDSFGGSQEIAGTLLNERAPITRGGLEKVTSRLGQSRTQAMDMVKAAEQQGTQGVVPKDVISEFGDVVKELRKRVDIGQADELPKVGARGKAILRTTGRTGGDIPLTKAQGLKETAQDASAGAYRAMERGTQKQLSADDMLDTATARGLKAGIERKVPGVKAQNQRSQALIGGKNALEDALEREGNTLGVGGAKDTLAMMAGGGAYAAGAGPAALPLAIGTRLMTTPSTGSMGAILLNEASKSGILDGATRAALISMMRSNQQ
jgi:ribosome modulation factor